MDTNFKYYLVLLIALTIIVSITFLLYKFLRGKDYKIKMIPLKVIAIIMVLLEGIKQFIHIKNNTYSYWYIPLHFCGLFIFIYPLFCFIKKEKIKNIFSVLSFSFSTLMTVLFYIGPRGVIGESPLTLFDKFSSFHAFTYHHLVILFLFIAIALNLFKIDKNYIKDIIISLTIYGFIAVPMAFLLNTNYCNILYSNIPFMEAIRVNLGQVIYIVIMYLLGILGSIIVCYSYKKIRKDR